MEGKDQDQNSLADKIMLAVLGVALGGIIFVILHGAAFGAKPPCTGDRHGSCPVTPTTLPPVECPVVMCPVVTCDCTDTPVTVYVEPYKAPMYHPCRRRKNGTLRCPHPKAPKRVLVPMVEPA